jgi:hypothetical protein
VWQAGLRGRGSQRSEGVAWIAGLADLGVKTKPVCRHAEPASRRSSVWAACTWRSSRSAGSARLRADLRGWLARLDPDGISDLHQAPTRTWQHDGWSVTFRVIPKKLEAQGANLHQRAIGAFGHGEARIIETLRRF